MEVLNLLKQVPDFKDVPDDQLQWLVAKSDCLSISKGEPLFAPGNPIDKMLIIIDGSFVIKMPRNNQYQILGRFEKHTITGLLPYSRATEAKAIAEAVEDAKVISLNEKYFKEMIHDCHELTTVLVHAMSTRIRQFTKREQQDDKMLALGK
ncbi:MAG: Crp/Fnr family transcriptional regulator, partial [Bacteroidota bacterium]